MLRMVESTPNEPRLPRALRWAIVLICVAPAMVLMLGAEFGGLSGLFTHTILEWSALSVAMLTAVLALSHFHITGAVTTVMAIALLASSLVEACHTLVAHQMVGAGASFAELVPLSATVARSFGALVITIGALALLMMMRRFAMPKDAPLTPPVARLTFGLGAVFALSASAIVWLELNGETLPQTVFADAPIARPYDLAFLPVLSVAGVLVCARLYRRAPSFFTHALLISWIPTIASWMHLVLGSRTPFDNNSTISLGLKLLAQLVPFFGLCLDHMSAHDRLKAEVVERASAEAALRKSEKRTRAIVDTAADAIVLIDKRGSIISANRACHDVFGYAPEELTGRSVNVLMRGGDHDMHDRAMARMRDGGEPRVLGLNKRQVEGQHRGGLSFPLELTVNQLDLDGEAFFVGICRDISERVKAEKLKNEFISTMNHELRTPLTSIRGALGLVSGGLGGALPAKAKQLMEIASRNTDQLVKLVDDILDLDRIASGELRFEVRALDATPLVVQSIAAIEGYAQQFGVQVRLEQSVQAVIEVDSDRFTQVMTNLLSNAIKFSEEGSEVVVSMQRVANRLRISVRDLGPGIPKSFRPRVFEQFTQADGSDSRKRGGTGLGLHICKTILAELGGTIDFHTDTNLGTTFFVELEGVWTDSHHARVLVCEDNFDIARLLRLMLQADGYLVDVAGSVAASRELLKKHHYCAMTLDLALPDEDGLRLLRQLRERVPVVVISALASESRERRGGEPLPDGADQVLDWIDKPIDEARLLRALHQTRCARPSEATAPLQQKIAPGM